MVEFIDKNEKVCGTCNYFLARDQQKVTYKGIKAWKLSSSCENLAVSRNASVKADKPACKNWKKWDKI